MTCTSNLINVTIEKRIETASAGKKSPFQRKHIIIAT
jgi:hypothetical protein